MLQFAQRAYPEVTFRHVIGPKVAELTETKAILISYIRDWFKWIPLNYGRKEVSEMFDNGMADGRAVMASDTVFSSDSIRGTAF